MTDSLEDNASWETVNLSYFFWLPAGKDEFGFKEYGEAPLKDTAYYRDLHEETIAVRFGEQVDALREPTTNKLAFMTLNAPQTIDGELGLRKIHFEFHYEPSHPALRGMVRPGLIKGAGTILSNGLYLWTFRIDYRKGTSKVELRQALERFLVEDFVERHIRRLLHFQWNADKAGGEISDYQGILTYFQLDLLFNGVLDPAGHPHLALEARRRDDYIDSDDQRARASYTVQSLIKSLSLCALGADYFPLFDKRKTYTLRGTYEQTNPHIDGSIDLQADRVPGGKELDDREILLSRLAFAGMEQFLRVAISFGLTHYKAALDHIRAELVDMSMRSYKNRSSGELRRPSLEAKSLTVADLEAHQALLAGKVPVLTFLLDLIDGLAEVSRPLRDPQLNGRDGAAEWLFAKSTLDEARAQFRRQVTAISTDVFAIEASLNAVRTATMLQELTEARKLQEIATETVREVAEVPQSVTLAGGQTLELGTKHLEMPLTVVALFIGGFEILSSALLFITEKTFANAPLLPERVEPQHWVILGLWCLGGLMLIAAFGFIIYLLFRNARKPSKGEEVTAADQPGREPRSRVETHVFDYSSLLKDVTSGSRETMELLCTQMVDIESPRGARVECVNYSTLRETPSNGTERIKYSLESPTSRSELAYVLHVEVDRRLSDGSERLQDIRLLVRRPTKSRHVNVEQAAAQIITACLQALVFTGDNQGEARPYVENRMGLGRESTDPSRRARR